MYKKAHKKIRVNTEEFSRNSTGEIMNSEIPNITSVNIVDENHIIIDSKEYIILDKVALDYLELTLPEKDMVYVYKLINMCGGKHNFILDKKDNPLTKEDLRVQLKLATTRFKSLMKTLFDRSVIGIYIVSKERKVYKYLTLNPTLARRNKILDAQLRKIFPDLTALVEDKTNQIQNSKEF